MKTLQLVAMVIIFVAGYKGDAIAQKPKREHPGQIPLNPSTKFLRGKTRQAEFTIVVSDTSITSVSAILDTAIMGGKYASCFGLDTIAARKTNSVFEIKASGVNHPSTLHMLATWKNGKQGWLLRDYVCFPYDKIHINVKNDKQEFTGKGAAKYDYLYKVSKMPYHDPYNGIFKDGGPVVWQQIQGTWRQIDTIVERKYKDNKEKLQLLNSFVNRLTKDEYKFLMIENLSSFKSYEYNICVSAPSSKYWVFVNNSYDFLRLRNKISLRDKEWDHVLDKYLPIYLYSSSYLEYELQTLLDPARLNAAFPFPHTGTSSGDYQSSFKRTYGEIANAKIDYTLKEKLLGKTVFSYLKALTTEQEKIVIDYSLATLHNPQILSALRRLQQQVLPVVKGAPIADYTFIDTAGNKVKLSQFKNKIVVVDLWFTGCGACIYVAHAMPEVEKILKNNPDVVFLSLSIDADKDVWLKSINPKAKKDEKYNHAAEYYSGNNSIYWNLNSTGYKTVTDALNTDFLKTYVPENGYPTLLIIGKDGKFFMKNPPRPDAEGPDKLAQIINQALATNN